MEGKFWNLFVGKIDICSVPSIFYYQRERRLSVRAKKERKGYAGRLDLARKVRWMGGKIRLYG